MHLGTVYTSKTTITIYVINISIASKSFKLI